MTGPAEANRIGALLKVEIQGRRWAVPLETVEKVSRAGDLAIDQEGSQSLVHDDEGPVPLATLEASRAPTDHQRILWLRHHGARQALAVDEVKGHVEAGQLFELPSLPFSSPPPILGLAGNEADTLAVLDLERLGSPLPVPPSPSNGVEAPPGGDMPEPQLMLLPALADGTVPALSVAQVLGFEAIGEIFALPALPAWCPGVGWWRGRPIGIFDLAGRLDAQPPAEGTAARWLIASVPGGGHLALVVRGRCLPTPLPDEANVATAQGALADAVYGLFETEQNRLALLDLSRWRRASG